MAAPSAPGLVTSGPELERTVRATWVAPSPGGSLQGGSAPVPGLHAGQTRDRAAESVRSAFDAARCGVWVGVSGGKVQAFEPFANPEYRSGARREELLGEEGVAAYAARKAKALGWARPEELMPDVDRWWFNGHVVCNVMPRGVWGGFYLDAVRHMLDTAAARDAALQCNFIFNKRDFPMLRRGGAWVGPSCALPRPGGGEPRAHTLPVLSFFGGDGFADALLPTVDDWGLACGWEWMPPGARAERHSSEQLRAQAEKQPWKGRRGTAVFRGSATGPGTTTDTNQRLHLALASMVYPGQLDAGITSWTGRDRKSPGDATMSFVDPREMPFELAPRLTMQEQMQYRYVVYVQGHAAAARLGTLLHLGCVVLRVRETTPAPRLWCDSFLRGVDVDSTDEAEWAGAHFVWVSTPFSVPAAVDALEAREDRCLAVLRNASTISRLWWGKSCMTSFVRSVLASAAAASAPVGPPSPRKRAPHCGPAPLHPPETLPQPTPHRLMESPPPRLEARAESRRDFLFSMLPREVVVHTAVDEVALFSVTEARTAEAMARDILKVAGPRPTVTDATACVSGNVLAMAAAGARVRAVELDPGRFRMLTHNLALWASVVPACTSVEAFGGDCLALVPRMRQDVVFVDPPWGGPGAGPDHEITLGGLPLVEACARLSAASRFLALKLPPSLDLSRLLPILEARCGMRCALRRKTGGGRMAFLILARPNTGSKRRRGERGRGSSRAAAYDAPRDVAARRRTQGMRALNNFVKSVLITSSVCVHGRDATSRAPHVLDLACGEAGDILKWDHERFAGYVGIDVSDGQLARARERLKAIDRSSSLRYIRSVSLMRANVAEDDLDARLSPDKRFDCISVQFALHYMGRTRESLMSVMDLVSRRLLPRGVFIATLPCADAVRAACGSRGEWSNPLCTVRVAPDGGSYTFRLVGCVPDSEPEYFVSADLLRAAARSAGLEVDRIEPLPEFVGRMRRLPVYAERARTMGVPSNLSPDEAAVASLYQVCVLRQPDGPAPAPSRMPRSMRIKTLVDRLTCGAAK